MASTALDLNNIASTNSAGASAWTSQIGSMIDKISGISQANTAANSAMAEEQREWSAEQAAITRRFNAAEAEKSRNWQEQMSNTAHQREVKDAPTMPSESKRLKEPEVEEESLSKRGLQRPTKA